MKKWMLVMPLALSGALFADVNLPLVFTDHAVLAKTKATPVFGWADKGEAVEDKL